MTTTWAVVYFPLRRNLSTASLEELVADYNRATAGTDYPRPEIDKDRKFFCFATANCDWQDQTMAAQLIFNFLSTRKLPANYSLPQMVWELVTSLVAENFKLALRFALTFLPLMGRVDEIAKWQRYYATLCSSSDEIYDLFEQRLQALAQSPTDQRLIAHIP